MLAAEGLLDAERKRPLPFLPGTVGLVCGRASAAERDVVENARKRWPAVRFEIREVAVQGSNAVTEVGAAVRELDRDPAVEVIVIARGGGSIEDLLPFSNEALLRAVAAAVTPVVSAIGHEVDTPLLDLVADVRASTPTDAAKLVVPDVAEQLAGLAAARSRLTRAVHERLRRESDGLAALRSRPVLARPLTMVETREAEVRTLLERSRSALDTRLHRGQDEIRHLGAQVRALSPAATLDRGYAVVQLPDGHVALDPRDVPDGSRLRLRLARGELTAVADQRTLGWRRAEDRARGRPQGRRSGPGRRRPELRAGPRGAARRRPRARGRRDDARGEPGAVGARRGARRPLSGLARRRPRHPGRRGRPAGRADRSDEDPAAGLPDEDEDSRVR